MRLFPEGLFIKVAGVITEDDALLAVGLGANALGFDFGPTPWRVTLDDARAIEHRLPAGVITIGTFHHELPQRVVEVSSRLGLSAVELVAPVALADVSYVRERLPTLFVRLDIDTLAAEPAWLALADYVVVDPFEGLGALAAVLDGGFGPYLGPAVVAGGLSADEVEDVVRALPVWGVEAGPALEHEPGAKDPVAVGAFIAGARAAFAERPVAASDD